MPRNALPFDPATALVREPSVLLDPRFLIALQDEIERELEPRAAEAMLFQVGFLHGLREAERTLATAFAAAGAHAAFAEPAVLPLRLRALPGASLAFEGSWPECGEAAARLTRSGRAETPSCAVSSGFTSGWLSGLFEADVLVVETRCCAAGAEQCDFVARERESWRADASPRGRELAESVPIEALREALAQHDPPPERAPGGQPEDSVVHIWGPVMVVPYRNPDEALMALELLGSDPSTAEVGVVVVDLTDATLDEAYGAAAIERIVESAEAWGVETLLAGVSALSEPVVAGLERQPALVCKDLHSAIAAAFQIASTPHREV